MPGAPEDPLSTGQSGSVSGPRQSPPAEASYFGSAGSELFGWYYPPAGLARGVGFVLCKPFGYEAMCIHRSLRKLAERLAAEGYAVLRPDLPGTGDAAGGAHTPDLVARWLAGLRTARAWLRDRSGAGAAVYLGVRLGATLAAQAAAQDGGVEGLVLFAPLRSGGEFVREARAFRLLQSLPAPASGGEEAAGFPLSTQTCAALKSIDLGKLTARPASSVLLLGRDDLEEPKALAEHLESLGVALETRRVPGYAAMMQDAFDSVPPVQVFDAVLEWAAAVPGQKAGPPQHPPQLQTITLDGGGATEELVRFGSGGRLFGLLARPSEPTEPMQLAGGVPPGRPAVVFLNTGANHHVGPNRMYVEFSRGLAKRGWAALRFDVSGVGDSGPAPDGAENDIYSACSVDDARSALDLLAGKGIASAVLVGLCSGAYVAFHAAPDPRVGGLVLINQQTFHWKAGDSLAIAMRSAIKSKRFYIKALSQRATWRRLLRAEIAAGHLARAFARRAWAWVGRQGRSLWSLVTRGVWEHSDVARRFREFGQRGGRTLLVLGDFDGARDVVEEHLGADARSLRDLPEFAIEVMQGPDHTFTPVWTQAALLEVLAAHLERSFGAPPGETLRAGSSSAPASPPPSAPTPSSW